MQRTVLLITFILFSLTLNAQQFGLDYGRVISKFDYKNSSGEKLENIQSKTDNHLGLAFSLPIGRTDFYFLTGLAYNSYGSTYSDELLDNYYAWDVNYLAIQVGGGYEFLKSNSLLNLKNTNSESGLTFYVQFNTGMEFLLNGTQTINRQVYNLKGEEQFNKPLILAYGGLGVRYYASKSIAVFVQYTGGKSFSVFKSDAEDNEKLNIVTHTISLGINACLPSRK